MYIHHLYLIIFYMRYFYLSFSINYFHISLFFYHLISRLFNLLEEGVSGDAQSFNGHDSLTAVIILL